MENNLKVKKRMDSDIVIIFFSKLSSNLNHTIDNYCLYPILTDILHRLRTEFTHNDIIIFFLQHIHEDPVDVLLSHSSNLSS